MTSEPRWEELPRMRERLGLSQAEVAKRMKASQAHVARIEKEPLRAKVATFFRYLAACEQPCPPLWVMKP